MLRGKREAARESERQRENEALGGHSRATALLCHRLKMPHPRWNSCLLATLGVLLIHLVAGAHGHCWDSGWCRDMDTDAEAMECLRACRMSLTDESPLYPGNGHLQPLTENIRKYVMSHFRWNRFSKGNGSASGPKRGDLLGGRGLPGALAPPSSSSQESESWDGGEPGSPDRQEGKRSYAMEHFRWGKPVGRKRRPIKVYPNGVEEESSESDPQEVRRDLSWEEDYPEELRFLEDKKDSEDSLSEEEQPEEAKKSGGQYQMGHFRWSAPPPPPAKKKRYGGFMTSERGHTPLVTLFKNAIIKTAYKKDQ